MSICKLPGNCRRTIGKNHEPSPLISLLTVDWVYLPPDSSHVLIRLLNSILRICVSVLRIFAVRDARGSQLTAIQLGVNRLNGVPGVSELLVEFAHPSLHILKSFG